MATINATTTPPIADSSLPAGTNATSTVFTTLTTSSQTTRSTDVGRPPDTWTTSTFTFVTVIHSTPTTSTSTTIMHISAARSSDSLSIQPPSAVGLLTRPTTAATVTEEVLASSASTSTTVASESKSQRRPSVAVFVVIGLVVASFIAVIFLLFCRRRRHHGKRKEVDYTFKRPDSSPSFLDADPFVSVPQNLSPVMRSAEDEVQRRTTHPVRWDSASNGVFVLNPPKPKSYSATLSSQHGTQRSSPCLPATYPSIFWEQDEMIGGEGQLLEHDATKQNLDETPTLIPVSYHHPPPRPPRSPRRKSKRLARSSLDSVSTAHSSSAPLLYSRLEDLPYHGTTPLIVQKKLLF